MGNIELILAENFGGFRVVGGVVAGWGCGRLGWGRSSTVLGGLGLGVGWRSPWMACFFGLRAG